MDNDMHAAIATDHFDWRGALGVVAAADWVVFAARKRNDASMKWVMEKSSTEECYIINLYVTSCTAMILSSFRSGICTSFHFMSSPSPSVSARPTTQSISSPAYTRVVHSAGLDHTSRSLSEAASWLQQSPRMSSPDL